MTTMDLLSQLSESDGGAVRTPDVFTRGGRDVDAPPLAKLAQDHPKARERVVPPEARDPVFVKGARLPSLSVPDVFPSQHLVARIRAGMLAWLSNFADMHALGVNYAPERLPSTEDVSLLIEQGVREAISAAASMIKQTGNERREISDHDEFRPIFAELLRRYLPMMPARYFGAIESTLLNELRMRAERADFTVNYGRVEVEKDRLVLAVRDDVQRLRLTKPGKKA
jgi:hypothetical protein